MGKSSISMGNCPCLMTEGNPSAGHSSHLESQWQSAELRASHHVAGSTPLGHQERWCGQVNFMKCLGWLSFWRMHELLMLLELPGIYGCLILDYLSHCILDMRVCFSTFPGPPSASQTL